MKAKFLVSAAMLTVLITAPAGSQENQQWIVIGDDAASTFASTMAVVGAERQLLGTFSVVESINGRTVMRLDPAAEGLLHAVVHVGHHRCGGYTVHPTREAALAEASNPFYSPDFVADPDLFPRSIDQHAIVEPALDLVDGAEIIATIQMLQDLGTRYYQSENGQKAALELQRRWEDYGAGRSDFSVSLYEHAWRQNSVIATIQGAELPDEIVVIGAHLDSINISDQNAAPGADDDASGIATVSEVLRVILESGVQPKRTLQFMAYAAEEVGLLGSGEIALNYQSDGRRVIAALQMDMTGFAGSEKNLYFVTDYVSANLTDFLQELIGEYNGPGAHQITFDETQCGYACSDHNSWTKIGVPSAFPFEARFADYNRHIHSPGDTLSNIDATGTNQARFAKLGLEFMIELGKSAGPPIANQ